MQERFITPHLIIFNKMHYYSSLLMIAMFSLLIISSTTTMAYPYGNYYYPPYNYPPPFSFETPPPPPPPASSSPGNNYGSAPPPKADYTAPPPPPDTYNQDSPPPSDNNYGAPSPPPPDNNYGTPPSPSPPNGNDDDEKTQFLKEHNKARHNISGVAMADLVWNDNLADYALTYAKKRTDCGMVHSEGPYGENIAAGSSKDFSAKDAVDLWVGEKSNYDYSSNKCPGGDKVCGHYTQVVWNNTIRLGCARVGCSNSGIFMICSYDPPGNVGDQKPY